MMMSPLSRISAGSFFSGLICEYSSLGWPGTTVAGTNSILSIRPSSIAAMRTLRAKGEAGEKVSFMWSPHNYARRRMNVIASHRVGARRRPMTGSSKQSKATKQNWIASSLTLLAMTIGPQRHKPSSRDDFLPLLAEPFDAERDHVAGVEELRRLHAGADAGRGAGGDDVAGQQRHEL